MPHTYDLIIIGAGPAGIEAGLAASTAGLDFLILERGRVAENMRRWGFVTMFSPWRMNVSANGEERISLDELNPDAFPTGNDYITHYLNKLAQHADMQEHIKTGVNVLRVGRDGAFKNTLISDSHRASLPFTLLTEEITANGERAESNFSARAVIDASGVYGNHRWLGSGGIPCIGERENRKYISYELADIAPAVEKSELQLHIAVVGNGFSACTLLESAKELNDSGKRINVSWITAEKTTAPVREVADDPLPYRARLAKLANTLAADPPDWLNYKPGYRITRIKSNEPNEQAVTVTISGKSEEDTMPLVVQRIFALVGYVPDRRIYEELQVHECWATSGPMKLAASLLSQQGGDCLTLTTEGDTLHNPEPNFFIIGAKSYGRNPDFLIDRLKAQVAVVFETLASSIP